MKIEKKQLTFKYFQSILFYFPLTKVNAQNTAIKPLLGIHIASLQYQLS